jgi:hypothetical protein
MRLSPNSALPNELDVEKLLCELTIEEKVALTAGKCGEFSSLIREVEQDRS